MSFNWNRYTHRVNINFFKKWTPQMAYILGFTFADGNVYKSTLAWDLKEERDLLEKINQSMGSTYPINKRKASWRLRISNQMIIDDLMALGVTPNKSKKMIVPSVPLEFFSHFARGFWDGDGWIYIRTSRNEISVGVSSGDNKFLYWFAGELSKRLNLTVNNLRKKRKITKKGFKATTYQIDYYWGNAYRVLIYLYSNLTSDDLFMERKYKKFQEAIELYQWLKSGGKKWRQIEKEKNQPMKAIISELWEKGYNGPQMADKLGVHHSSIYRWLIKTGVRSPFTEIRRKGFTDE